MYISTKVGLLTAQIGDIDHLDVVELAVGRVGESGGFSSLVVDFELGRVLSVGSRERLQVDVKVIAASGFAELVLDVGNGGLVAGRGEHSVAFLRSVCERLELARTIKEIFTLDVVSKAFLSVLSRRRHESKRVNVDVSV